MIRYYHYELSLLLYVIDIINSHIDKHTYTIQSFTCLTYMHKNLRNY